MKRTHYCWRKSWKKNQIWNSSYYDENGNIIGKFVNGEWIGQ